MNEARLIKNRPRVLQAKSRNCVASCKMHRVTVRSLHPLKSDSFD